MKTKFYLIIPALTVLSFVSCLKTSDLLEQTSVDLADDEAVSDAIFEDVFSTADNATIILDNVGKGLDSKSEYVVPDTCPTITITKPTANLWPRIVTVDYGTGCTGLNNNVRKGKIVIEVTGPRVQPGSKRTVTFVDYFFNDIKVEGTKVFESMGLNSNQNMVFSAKLTGGKLTLPNGMFIERSFIQEREWIAGLNTKNIWDDECLVTGAVIGKNIKGVSYTNTITTALHWKRVCQFIVSGVVKIERAGVQAVEINYGDGECDAKATVIRGGESKEILLMNKHRLMGN